MYDLIIRNGLVVLPEKVEKLDIGIKDGKIAALTLPGITGNANCEVEASGKYIFPGGIDAHVHMDDLGAEDTEDWRHGSYAAVCGGTTTVVDMPIDCVPATTNCQAVKKKLERIKGNAYTDYLLWGGLTTDNLVEIKGMLEEGVIGLKCFLTDSGLPDYPKTSDAVLLEAMKIAAYREFPIMIHAENQEMNHYYEKRYEGSRKWEDWSRMHPLESELEAVEKSILFAERTGARIHLAHISSIESIERIQEAKQKKIKITCETCPHYLMFCEEDYKEKGALLKCSPPVRGSNNKEALWKAISDGKIDIISSDHSPYKGKTSSALGNETIETVWAGISGIQNILHVLYSEGYRKKKISLEKIAEIFSLNPAKLLGIDKYKGSIAIGKEADLVILNPNADTQFDERQIKTKLKNSVYKDYHFEGDIEQTFVRGVRVTEHIPEGRYIRR